MLLSVVLCVEYHTFLDVASINADDIKPTQSWFSKWSILYFRGMKLFGEDDDDDDDEALKKVLIDKFIHTQQNAEDMNEYGWRSWWPLRKPKYPHVYESAWTILTIAPTEAAVERSFSRQGLIHSD